MFKVDLKKITIAYIFSVFYINSLAAQDFSFDLTNAPLNFGYTNYTDFTTPRTIVNAFTLNIGTNGGKKKDRDYNIFCRIIPNVGTSPTALFSIQVNYASFQPINYSEIQIGPIDVLLASVSGRKKKQDIISYDIILKPLPFTFDASLYNYNFVFTVVEIN